MKCRKRNFVGDGLLKQARQRLLNTESNSATLKHTECSVASTEKFQDLKECPISLSELESCFALYKSEWNLSFWCVF